jgi:hypothetical protein
MNIPDVIGLDYKDARIILEQKGIKIKEIKITAPPRHTYNFAKDHFKVLKMIPIKEKGVEILLCNPFVDGI